MFPLKKPKTLNEMVFALNEWAQRLDHIPPESGDSEARRSSADEVGKLLANIRKAAWARSSDSTAQPDPEQLAALAKEVYSTDVIIPLLRNVMYLDFDARKDVTSFVAFILKRQPTVDYLQHRSTVLFPILMKQAGTPEIHRTACQVIREFARHEALCSQLMNQQCFWLFFGHIDDVEFEVATDNFSTLQEILRNYPELTARFLNRNTDYFMKCVNGLILSDGYVAKRQALRLLFHLIRQQRNHKFLLAYVDSLESLKLIMDQLRCKSKNICFDAFQIFKIFVANPNKQQAILNVLIRNKRQLVEVLQSPHTLADRHENIQYQKEREYVKRKILSFPDIDTSNPAKQRTHQTHPLHQAYPPPNNHPHSQHSRSQPQPHPSAQSQRVPQ